MSKLESIKEAHSHLLQDSLSELKEEDPILASVLSYRLVIERLGENDNNAWWDSRILSGFGGESIGEVTPKTAGSQRLMLAQKIGRKVESEKLPENSVSLFNLTPDYEARINNMIEELEIGDLQPLETLEVELEETSWSSVLVPSETAITEAGEAVEIGGLDSDELQSGRALQSHVERLVAAYGESTKHNLQIPYYSYE